MFGGGNFGGNQFSQQAGAMTNPMGSAMNIQEVAVAQGGLSFTDRKAPPARARDKSGRRASRPSGNPSWPWSSAQ